MEVLEKYDVDYLVVGGLERASYPPDSLAKFDAFPEAFRSGEVVIYDVKAAMP
jgi:uncharacterized membrane protein